MQSLPRRTGQTELSDDELLLFDMMFDCHARQSQLSAEGYSVRMNCRYNHSLDNAELNQKIEELLSRGLIKGQGNTRNSDEPGYSLSESGGELWELERQPDWPRFVVTSHGIIGSSPTGSIVALCLDESIGRLCLGAMFSFGFMTPTSSIRCRQLCGKRLVPWKTFPVVHALRCSTSDNIGDWPRAADSCGFESVRRWWQTLNELQVLPA